jgi:hypothetical protein
MWFYQSPSALTRTVDGDVFLGSQRPEGIDRLSGTARAVWRLLESPRTPQQRDETRRPPYVRHWMTAVRWMTAAREA